MPGPWVQPDPIPVPRITTDRCAEYGGLPFGVVAGASEPTIDVFTSDLAHSCGWMHARNGDPAVWTIDHGESCPTLPTEVSQLHRGGNSDVFVGSRLIYRDNLVGRFVDQLVWQGEVVFDLTPWIEQDGWLTLLPPDVQADYAAGLVEFESPTATADELQLTVEWLAAGPSEPFQLQVRAWPNTAAVPLGGISYPSWLLPSEAADPAHPLVLTNEYPTGAETTYAAIDPAWLTDDHQLAFHFASDDWIDDVEFGVGRATPTFPGTLVHNRMHIASPKLTFTLLAPRYRYGGRTPLRGRQRASGVTGPRMRGRQGSPWGIRGRQNSNL